MPSYMQHIVPTLVRTHKQTQTQTQRCTKFESRNQIDSCSVYTLLKLPEFKLPEYTATVSLLIVFYYQ